MILVNVVCFRSHSSSPRKILENSSSPSRGDNVEKKVISIHESLTKQEEIYETDETDETEELKDVPKMSLKESKTKS